MNESGGELVDRGRDRTWWFGGDDVSWYVAEVKKGCLSGWGTPGPVCNPGGPQVKSMEKMVGFGGSERGRYDNGQCPLLANVAPSVVYQGI